MIRKSIIVALLCAISITTFADFRTVSRAYEAVLDGVRLPVSVNGTLSIKQCADCTAKSLQVSAATQYSINNEAVDLTEFRRQLLQVRERGTQAVIVKHDLKSDVVTSISVSL